MRTSRRSEMARAHFSTRGPAETRKLAGTLGGLLAGNEIIHLLGGLGMGKTCFVQGLAAGMKVDHPAAAASPTFTLINEYPGRTPLYHVDLYRLEKPAEIRGLGLEEYFEQGVVAIEWAEKLPDDLRLQDLEVSLTSPSARVRLIELAAMDRDAAKVIGELSRALEGRYLPPADPAGRG